MLSCTCVAQISPATLFLIEGSGQSWKGAMNWGDGFITDRQLINERGMSDPNPFFLTLLTKPYLNNVVIAPHYYPPSISQATAQYGFPLPTCIRIFQDFSNHSVLANNI